MPIDLPDVSLWIPPKPALVRKATPDLLPPEDVRNVRRGAFAGAPFASKKRPTVFAIGTPAAGTGTSVSVSPPSSRAGDVLVYGISTEVGFASEASGYTDYQGSSGNGIGSGSARINVLGKTSSGSEGSVSGGLGSSHVLEQIIALRNTTVTPHKMNKAGGSGGTATVTAVTTTVPYCLLLFVVAHSQANAITAFSGSVVGSITGSHIIANNVTTQDDDGGLAFVYAYLPAAGSSGSFSATLAASGNWGAHLYAFAPA